MKKAANCKYAAKKRTSTCIDAVEGRAGGGGGRRGVQGGAGGGGGRRGVQAGYTNIHPSKFLDLEAAESRPRANKHKRDEAAEVHEDSPASKRSKISEVEEIELDDSDEDSKGEEEEEAEEEAAKAKAKARATAATTKAKAKGKAKAKPKATAAAATTKAATRTPPTTTPRGEEEFDKLTLRNNYACSLVDSTGMLLARAKVKTFSRTRVSHFHLAGRRNCTLTYLLCWEDGSKVLELIHGKVDETKVHRGAFYHLADRKGNFMVGFIRRVSNAVPLRDFFLHTPIEHVLPTETWTTSKSDREKACDQMLALYSKQTKKPTMSSLFTSIELFLVECRIDGKHLIVCANLHRFSTKPQCKDPDPVCPSCGASVVTAEQLCSLT